MELSVHALCLRGLHRGNFAFLLYPQIMLGVLTRCIFATVKCNYKNKRGQHTWHLCPYKPSGPPSLQDGKVCQWLGTSMSAYLSVPDVIRGLLDPSRWVRQVVPKRRWLNTYHVAWDKRSAISVTPRRKLEITLLRSSFTFVNIIPALQETNWMFVGYLSNSILYNSCVGLHENELIHGFSLWNVIELVPGISRQ